jgi:hypothetical protein
MTRDHLFAEPDGPAWRRVAPGEHLSLGRGVPGVYAHVTREHGYVLYVGTGTGKDGGVADRLRNEFRWVAAIRNAADELAIQRTRHEGVNAGLAEHDFETWAAVTDSQETAWAWEVYFQGLSWHLNRKRLPLRSWEMGARTEDDWVIELLAEHGVADAAQK